MPLQFLICDDIEVNNPRGKHKTINKLGVVYCTIMGIPPCYRSMLEKIFL